MLSSILGAPKVVSEPDADGHYNPFPSYPYTGSLRPVYPLSPRRAVPEKIRHPDYAHNGIPASEQVRSARVLSVVRVRRKGLIDSCLGLHRKKDHQSARQEGAGGNAQSVSLDTRSVGRGSTSAQAGRHHRRDR